MSLFIDLRNALMSVKYTAQRSELQVQLQRKRGRRWDVHEAHLSDPDVPADVEMVGAVHGVQAVVELREVLAVHRDLWTPRLVVASRSLFS